jgi:hypothetical protein
VSKATKKNKSSEVLEEPTYKKKQASNTSVVGGKRHKVNFNDINSSGAHVEGD